MGGGRPDRSVAGGIVGVVPKVGADGPTGGGRDTGSATSGKRERGKGERDAREGRKGTTSWADTGRTAANVGKDSRTNEHKGEGIPEGTDTQVIGRGSAAGPNDGYDVDDGEGRTRSDAEDDTEWRKGDGKASGVSKGASENIAKSDDVFGSRTVEEGSKRTADTGQNYSAIGTDSGNIAKETPKAMEGNGGGHNGTGDAADVGI